MSDEDPKLVEQLNKLLARESKGGAPPVPIAQIVQLFRIADPALRSRAARLVGRYISYGAFLQKRLQEEDHRVRANVIESLWGIDAPEVRAALRKAALDPHHRVRTNALIGLYRLGETKDVAARLIEQSRHNLQSYRVAAAWA